MATITRGLKSHIVQAVILSAVAFTLASCSNESPEVDFNGHTLAGKAEGLWGETVDPVRHQAGIPILVVR